MARHKTISNDDLLAVARRIFVKDGIAASSKEIARQAGVSEGVLFQRFSTKEDLFFAAMTPPPLETRRIFDHPNAQGQELATKITLALVDYFRALMPVLIPLMSHPAFRFEDIARRQPDSPLINLRRQLMAFMIREKYAGRIGPVDPAAAALVLWSTAHSVAFFEHLGTYDGEMPIALIRASVQCFWGGMQPQPPQR